MKKHLLSFMLLFSAGCFAEASVDINTMDYKDLYENGYYTEVITRLSDTAQEISVDFKEKEKKMQTLAFALILTGRRDEAIDIFVSIFNSNPEYYLDPILTSPKIYEIFSEGRRKWQLTSSSKGQTSASSRTDMTETAGLRIIKIMPFGAGQYINGEKRKGILFSVLQGGTLIGSIWAYNARLSHYDSNYGWYDGNKDQNTYYSNLMRVQFGVFVATYAWSVVDAFRSNKKDKE